LNICTAMEWLAQSVGSPSAELGKGCLRHPLISSAGEPIGAAVVAEADRVLDRDVGRLFCTAMIIHPGDEGERIYSSGPELYPLGGRKPLGGRPWTERVLRERLPHVADGAAAIAEHFPADTVMSRIGCGTFVNLPLVHGGELVGTLNFGDRAGRYGAAELEVAKRIACGLAPGLAAWKAARDARERG